MKGSGKVNIRSLVIIGAIVVVIISMAAFIFFRELLKESAPPPVLPTAPEVAEEKPPEGYAIPLNAIPDVAQLEKNTKKAQERRKESDKAIAERDTQRAQNTKLVREQAESADLAAREALSAPQSGKKETITRSVNRPARPSPQEQKKLLSAKGLLGY